MNKILIASLFVAAFSNSVSAKTEWYTEQLPGGLSTLTGVFDKSGVGVIFGCTENFFSAGAIFLKINKNASEPGPTQIKISTSKNENVDFSADLVPSAEDNYIFMSSNAIASLTTFHFLDTASNQPFQIELSNSKLSLTNRWLVDTSGSQEPIKEFKKSCPLIDR
ncbi:MAG TPA: hypothetical protein VGN40_16220 [Lelliottia sp.]|jgi:hypothetical protein